MSGRTTDHFKWVIVDALRVQSLRQVLGSEKTKWEKTHTFVEWCPASLDFAWLMDGCTCDQLEGM
jgi:hypothetical protein